MKEFIKHLKLEKWHFYLLGIVIVNFFSGLISGYKLNHNITFVLKAVLYSTGLILFFFSIRPFKKIAIYYSFYLTSGVLTGLFFMYGSILFAILSSFAIQPIFPKQTMYKNDKIKIYNRFQGFMARCCSYEVVEPKLYIIEKHLGYINIDRPIDADKNEFIFKNNTIIYKYELSENDKSIKTGRYTSEIFYFE